MDKYIWTYICIKVQLYIKIFRRKEMLDIKRIRENLDDIKKAMDRRGEKEFDLDAVIALDDERRELLKEVEVMKGEMNIESKKIRAGCSPVPPCSYLPGRWERSAP